MIGEGIVILGGLLLLRGMVKADDAEKEERAWKARRERNLAAEAPTEIRERRIKGRSRP